MNTTAALMLSALLGSAYAAPAVPTNTLLIVPGRSLGHTRLGADGARTLAALPKPTRSDAGMSQRYYVWLSSASHSHANTLFIHAVSNGARDVKPLSGLTIDTLRVTSPAFVTASGLHVGSTFGQIRHQFPHLRSVNTNRTLYDDNQRGIAFEFAHQPRENTRASAVTVHTPGQAATATASQVSGLLKMAP